MLRRVMKANCSTGCIFRVEESPGEGGEGGGAHYQPPVARVDIVPLAHRNERCFNAMCSSVATRKARQGSSFRFICGSSFCEQMATVALRHEVSRPPHASSVVASSASTTPPAHAPFYYY